MAGIDRLLRPTLSAVAGGVDVERLVAHRSACAECSPLPLAAFVERLESKAFRTVAMTDGARDGLRQLVVDVTTPVGRRVSISDVASALIAVGRAHMDELIAELSNRGDAAQGE